MTKQEKIEAIRLKVVEAIPEAEAISGYEGEKLLYKPITAIDILRALGDYTNTYFLDTKGNLQKDLPYEPPCLTGVTLDLNQTLSEWSEETINELYKLFYE